MIRPQALWRKAPTKSVLFSVVGCLILAGMCQAGELARHKLLTADQVGDALEILGYRTANRL